MKKLRFFPILILALVLSCKDKESVDPDSYFTVNGKSYPLTRGYLEDFGTNLDLISRDYDITLVNKDIVFDEDRKLYTGEGDVVYLDLNVNSTEKFVGGSFQWSATRGPSTIVSAFVGTTCSLTNGFCSYKNLVLQGSATVEVNNNSYIVNFTLNTEDGQTVTGYFKGPLETL